MREYLFMKQYLKRAKTIKMTVNLNKVGAQNQLTFNASPASGFENSGKTQVILSLVNKSGNARAWLAVQPKILKKNGKIFTYFTLGRSHIHRKGYGEFLRALANKIGRDVGAQGSNQWAVNMNRMGGPEPPSAGIMRKLGASPYKHPNSERSRGLHFFLPKERSRANTILRNRFGVKIPNIPRTYMNQFILLLSVGANIPKTAMSKNNAHETIIKKIKDPNMMNALDRIKRRVPNNRISPYNLAMKYRQMLNPRVKEIRALQNKLIKRRKINTSVPSVSVRRSPGREKVSVYNVNTY
jgi:hypothetical protein